MIYACTSESLHLYKRWPSLVQVQALACSILHSPDIWADGCVSDFCLKLLRLLLFLFRLLLLVSPGFRLLKRCTESGLPDKKSNASSYE